MDGKRFIVETFLMNIKHKISLKEKSGKNLINIAEKVRVGKRLKCAREGLNITQSVLANMLGKKQEEIARYESGQNLTMDYIITLSKKTKKPLYWFFETEEETKHHEFLETLLS